MKDYFHEYNLRSVINPNSLIMLTANTLANICLCTYHEKMQLVVSAIEKLPRVLYFLQHVTCDLNSRHCMLQSCQSCCKLLLLKQYCRVALTDENH